jgi:hypothetical protein
MVECLNCKSNNPIDSKFCIICGNALIKKCSSCNLDLPAVARFCMECGVSIIDSTNEENKISAIKVF